MSKGNGKAANLGSELLASVEAHVAEIVRDELARANVPAAQIESRAGGVGKRVADKLRYTWAGQLAYFPVDRVRRDALIYDEFAGDNHSELARRYHVSVQTIYKIIKAEKDRRQYKQLSLL